MKNFRLVNKIVSIDKRIIVAAIFIIAIVSRIGLNIIREEVILKQPLFLCGKSYDESIFSDAIMYDDTARSIMKGKGISVFKDSRTWGEANFTNWISLKKIDSTHYAHKSIPPLYPLFLALCYSIGGINTASYFIPQVILSALSCVFIYLLAKEIFNEEVAILSGFAMVFYPDLIFLVNFIRSENLFIFLLTLGFLLLVKGNSKSKPGLLFASAVIFGLACLTRVTLIPFLPFIFFWEILFFSNKKRDNFRIAGIMMILAILVLLPWCIRNFLIFKEFTPFSDEVYVVLITDDHNWIAQGEYYFRLNNSMVSRITGFIEDNFREYIYASFKRFIIFWSPYTDEMKNLAKVYKTITWLIVIPFALVGMIISRKRWEISGLIVLFVVFHALLHAASFVDKGLIYRYPIQPFLCIFASYTFWLIYRKYNLVKNNQ